MFQKSVQNDINPYMTTQHIEVNKVDSIGKVNGTGLEIEALEDKIFILCCHW